MIHPWMSWTTRCTHDQTGCSTIAMRHQVPGHACAAPGRWSSQGACCEELHRVVGWPSRHALRGDGRGKQHGGMCSMCVKGYRRIRDNQSARRFQPLWLISLVPRTISHCTPITRHVVIALLTDLAACARPKQHTMWAAGMLTRRQACKLLATPSSLTSLAPYAASTFDVAIDNRPPIVVCSTG